MRFFLTMIAMWAGLTCLPAAAADLPAAALQEDIAVMRAAIEEGHPGARRYLTQSELIGVFDRAEEAAEQPMDSSEFYAVLARIVGDIGDGHTYVDLSEADSEAFWSEAPLLPFRFFVRNGRIFVLRDLHRGSPPLEGREVVAINGVQAGEILSRMLELMPRDGSILSSREHELSNSLNFNRLYALVHGAVQRYTLRLRDGRVHEVDGMLLAALQENWEARFPGDHVARPLAELQFADNGEIAVLTIRGFERFIDEARTQRMDRFFADAFAQIKARAVRALIIDVRGNGGGADELGRELFSYLAERPFHYYEGIYLQSERFSFYQHASPSIERPPPDRYDVDALGRLRWREHPNYGEHQPATDRFAGPAYILIDGGSFSTTSEFLSIADHQERALFVGEEAGGGRCGNGSGVAMTVTLPNSGMRLHLPLWRYDVAVNCTPPADRGVRPDRPVTPSVRDILHGRDRAMETALRLAKRGRRS